MKQYIDKCKVVEEIEKMLQNEYACETSQEETGYHCALHELKHFLDTLEVKEVDLEENNSYFYTGTCWDDGNF